MSCDNHFHHDFAMSRESLLAEPREPVRNDAPDEGAVAWQERRESSPEIMLGTCIAAWLVVAGFTVTFMLVN